MSSFPYSGSSNRTEILQRLYIQRDAPYLSDQTHPHFGLFVRQDADRSLGVSSLFYNFHIVLSSWGTATPNPLAVFSADRYQYSLSSGTISLNAHQAEASPSPQDIVRLRKLQITTHHRGTRGTGMMHTRLATRRTGIGPKRRMEMLRLYRKATSRGKRMTSRQSTTRS